MGVRGRAGISIPRTRNPYFPPHPHPHPFKLCFSPLNLGRAAGSEQRVLLSCLLALSCCNYKSLAFLKFCDRQVGVAIVTLFLNVDLSRPIKKGLTKIYFIFG